MSEVSGTDLVAWTKSKRDEAARDANLVDFDNYSEALDYWERFSGSDEFKGEGQ